MSILFPTYPAPQSAEPYFLDAGGVQRSLGAGEDMRLDRLGDRFGITVSLIPMRWRDLTTAAQSRAAMVWVSRLIQAKSQGGILPWPQPGFAPQGNPTTATAAAVSGSSQVQVVQVGGAVSLLEGQFVTHIRKATGRRYLYVVRADTVLPANGGGVVPLWPRVRGPIAPGDDLVFDKPTIEGLAIGNTQAWSLAVTKLATITFRLEERG